MNKTVRSGHGGGLLKKDRNPDISSLNVPRFGKEVSFQDTHSFGSTIGNQNQRKRTNTLQPRTVFEDECISPQGRNLFPPFIPDDPEKPHLSSSKKEKERREIIVRILRQLLRYNKEDWTDDTMKVQESIFDSHNAPKNPLWYRLAMNLLYAGKNKNLVKRVRETPFDRSRFKREMTQSFSSSLAAVSKRQSIKRIKEKEALSKFDADSKEGSVGRETDKDAIMLQKSSFSPAKKNAILQAMQAQHISVSKLIKDPSVDQQRIDKQGILQQSNLNAYGYFDKSVRKQKGAKLNALDQIRAQSPVSARIVRIESKLGGKPKPDQMVREGHYPKISAMIDQIEKIAIDYVDFENFLDLTKTQTLKDLKDIEDILAGRKIEEPSDSMDELPIIST